VVLDRHVSMPVDTVRCDSEGGAYDLITHLVALGHRRIALLGGSPAVSTAQDRADGYRRALAEAGVPVDEALVRHRDYTQEGGYAMTRSILELPDRPTALFAVNNFIAIGAVRALRDAGLRIPDDIALVGFDDLPQSLVVEPFLTVASQPAYEMGARATELLLARIKGLGEDAPVEVILPTELIVRKSSGVGIKTEVGV
jgi:LacI family transcriptional regulator